MNALTWLHIPTVVLWIGAAVALLLALRQGFSCRRHWRGCRRVRAGGHAVAGMLVLALALLLAGSAWSLRGYRLLTREQPVLAIHALQLGPQWWQLQLDFPDGRQRSVELAGDAWRLEAVVLKWQLPALLAGLPPVYRLDRLSGRYVDAGQAAVTAPSVIAFEGGGEHDLFRLALAHHDWLSMVDTVYGSGAWMPLVDGADYQVNLMRTGALVARRRQPAVR